MISIIPPSGSDFPSAAPSPAAAPILPPSPLDLEIAAIRQQLTTITISIPTVNNTENSNAPAVPPVATPISSSFSLALPSASTPRPQSARLKVAVEPPNSRPLSPQPSPRVARAPSRPRSPAAVKSSRPLSARKSAEAPENPSGPTEAAEEEKAPLEILKTSAADRLSELRAELERERETILRQLDSGDAASALLNNPLGLEKPQPQNQQNQQSGNKSANPSQPNTQRAATANGGRRFDFPATPLSPGAVMAQNSQAATLKLNKKANTRSRWRFGNTPLKARAPVSVATLENPARVALAVHDTVWLAGRERFLEIRLNYSSKLLQRIVTPLAVWCMLHVPHLGVVWCGTETGAILIYHAHSGKLLGQIQEQSGLVYCLAIAADKRTVYSGSTDWTVITWRLQRNGSGQRVQALNGHSNSVRALLPIGSTALWTGSDDHTIRVWNTITGECTEELTRHSGSVLALLATGNGIWSAAEDGTILSWEIFPRVRATQQITLPQKARIHCMLLVGDSVWCVGHSTTIYVYDRVSMEFQTALPASAHKQFINGCIKSNLVLETRFLWSHSVLDSVAIWRSEYRPLEDPSQRWIDAITELSQEKAERVKERLKMNQLTHALVEKELRDRHAEAGRTGEMNYLIPQLAEARMAARQLQDENSRLNEENLRLRRANERLEDSLEKTNQKLKRSDQARMALTEELEKRRAEWEERERFLSSRLQQVEENYAALKKFLDGEFNEEKKKMKEILERNAALEKLAADLEKRLELSDLERIANEAATAALKAELAKAQAALEKAENQRKSEQEKMENLMNELRGELERERLATAAMEESVKAREAELKALQAEIDRLAEARSRDAKSSEKDANALRGDLKDLQGRFEKIFSHLQKAMAENHQLQNKRDSYYKEIQFLRFLLDAIARELKQAESDLSQFSSLEHFIPSHYQSSHLHSLSREHLIQTLTRWPLEGRECLKGVKHRLRIIIQNCFNIDQKLHIGAQAHGKEIHQQFLQWIKEGGGENGKGGGGDEKSSTSGGENSSSLPAMESIPFVLPVDPPMEIPVKPGPSTEEMTYEQILETLKQIEKKATVETAGATTATTVAVEEKMPADEKKAETPEAMEAESAKLNEKQEIIAPSPALDEPVPSSAPSTVTPAESKSESKENSSTPAESISPANSAPPLDRPVTAPPASRIAPTPPTSVSLLRGKSAKARNRAVKFYVVPTTQAKSGESSAPPAAPMSSFPSGPTMLNSISHAPRPIGYRSKKAISQPSVGSK